MDKEQAYSKYKGAVDIKILNGYFDPDKYVYFNKEDTDLCTIRYTLPECPDWDTIDGFGLPSKEQKFKVPEYPLKLKEAEKIVVKEKLILGEQATIDDIWEFLEKNKKEYKDCIDWIGTQWNRRLNGYWFFNNGKPTYIDGWQYFYCAFWILDTGLPEYRSRDALFFHFARMCYTDTYGIKTDDDGRVVYDEEGVPLLFNTGSRVCLGFNYPKHRRDGATYKACDINYEIISRTTNAMGGIQSMTGDSARKAFTKHLVRPWKKLPFFFKPQYDGSTDPKKELIFDKPGVKIGGKGSILKIDVGLESVINYAETAGGSYYDGEKLHFYHGDEKGKTVNENVREVHDIIKECLSLGSGMQIHGLCINTSTVEEMVDKGGQAFYELCEDSLYDQRNENNQTISGLYDLFIPAYDGLQGFIDEYGNSIIDDPKEPVLNSQGKLIYIGAKTYLNNIRKTLLDKNTAESMERYYAHCRLYPQSYAECFIGSGEDSGLPKQLLIQRINELNREENITITGNFDWSDGFGSDVIWNPNPEGRWQVSKVLSPNESNKRYIRDGVYYPQFAKKFMASADPFKFNKPQAMRIKGIRSKGRLSDGSGAVFWKRDMKLDPDDKDLMSWESCRFICTYSNRLKTKLEFCEDMLKMCIFYGSPMYPEVNVTDVWDRFIEWGYGGYLEYDVDPMTKRIKDFPGFNSVEKVKQDLFRETKEHLEIHCMRERHIDWLIQCRDIKGVEEMTVYDLFTACAGALRGIQGTYSSIIDSIKDECNLDGYVRLRKY